MKATVLRRMCLVLASCIAMLAAFVAIGIAPASATAIGCTRWGTVHVPDATLYSGQYCFGVHGNGTTVDFTDGSINTPRIVNFTEVVHLYDNWGRSYATNYEGVHQGNAYGFHYWRSGLRGRARVGTICGELLSSGVHVATVCERIG